MRHLSVLLPLMFAAFGAYAQADPFQSTVTTDFATLPADGRTQATITVTLLDFAGNPVTGAIVSLSDSTRNATISGASGLSDFNGVVTFTVTDKSAATDIFTATDVSDGVTIAQTPAIFFFAVVDPNQSTVTASPTAVPADGTTQSTLTVKLLDFGGQPFPGESVTLADSGGNAAISAPSGRSNANGIVTFTVTNSTAESDTFTARDATAGVAIAQTATVAFSSDPIRSTVTSNVTAIPADGATQATITVTLLDFNGSPVVGAPVSLTDSNGTAASSGPSGLSGGNGVVTFIVTNRTAGSDTLTATDDTDGVAITQTATVIFSTDPNRSTVTENSTAIPVGATAATITVRLLDNNGNPVAGTGVTLSDSTGNATISGPSGPSNGNGVVTFTVSDATPERDTFTAKDTIDGVAIAQRAAIGFFGPVVNAHSTVVAVPPTVVADGVTASTIAVTLLDVNFNPCSGKSVSLTADGGGSTISGGGVSDSNGAVSFFVKDLNLETVTYTATDSTDPLVLVQTASVTFTTGPGNATLSTVSANPTSLTADGVSASTLTVTLRDSQRRPVSGKAVTMTAGGHSILSAASGLSDVNGGVTFTVTDTTAEALMYSAKDVTDGVTISQTAVVTFIAGPVTAAQSTAGVNPSSVPANGVTASTVVVELNDAYGNPVSGKTVTLTAAGGSSTISVANGLSNAGGLVTFTVTDTTVEAVTYTAADITDSLTITQTATVAFTTVLSIDSGPTVTPDPASAGDAVQFSCGTNLPNSAFTWDFGDGFTDNSGAASVSHVYGVASAPGAFTVTATATNGVQTVSETLNLVVNPGVTITKRLLTAKNPSVGKDQLVIAGTLNFPAGVTSLSGSLLCGIGASDNTFTLNSHGSGKSGTSSFALKGKTRKGVLTSPTVTFSAKITGDLLAVIQTAGLDPGVSGPVSLPLQIVFAGTTYGGRIDLSVTATNKSEKGK